LAKIGEKLISVSDTIKQLQQLIRFAESVVFGAVWKINKFPGADRIHVEKCAEWDEEEVDS